MIPILYEDNHCLVVDKPAGLLSQGDATGDASVVDLVAADLKERFRKPGNVYVGLVHRLDRPVSGALLLARTSKAAARLSSQFREHRVEKRYIAIVEGLPAADSGIWNDVLRKDPRTNRVEVVTGAGDVATLDFRVVERSRGRAAIELTPTTGRGHQLRVQLASRGLPIVGDRKYGARSALEASDGGYRIALHALSLAFDHPTQARRIEVGAPLPSDWPDGFRGLGPSPPAGPG